VRELIRSGIVQSAHDCSEGGLAVALTECCFNPDGSLGADVVLSQSSEQVAATLFGEAQSRIIVSITAAEAEQVHQQLARAGVPHMELGTVTGDELRIRISEEDLRWSLAELHDLWFNSIRRAVEADSVTSTGSEH
jgi:phosphoribosylformylglycinamidine synthase